MTQETPKDVQVETKPQPAQELDATQAEAVGGGVELCDPADWSGQLQQAYDNLVDTASYVMERVATAAKSL